MISVRTAERADLAMVAAIYTEAIETPATFDLEPPPPATWEDLLACRDARAGNLFLVAEIAGEVVGYAKSGAHRGRPAYDTTRETGIYVDGAHRSRGVGDALYQELLSGLERSDAVLAVAGATQPNEASNALHRRHGFTEVGTFHSIGVKLGREWDVLWFERRVGG